MALRISCSSATTFFNFKSKFPFSPFLASFPNPNSIFSTVRITLCHASNSKPQNKRSSSSPTTKKKKKKTTTVSDPLNFTDFEILQDFPAGVDVTVHDDDGTDNISDSSLAHSSSSLPLPEPPAGFVLDGNGNVVQALTHRLVTIVDPTNNLPLECVVRRVFRSSEGHDCMLLCPVDTPIQILKSTNADGWSAVSDKEVESILPAAAYALAKIHMHLVYSGYCYTARGGFCYTEEDIFDFHTDEGKGVDGLPTEAVEITYFDLEGAQYMIYTPSDPHLFVAVKDQNGILQVADDELLEDAAIFDAIDEETEFNALAEEEAAFLESEIDR
ncbi:hypothetical protein Lal_00023862 [Lupinus albus]|uniref:Uncharacterized protein n=1 Tax=Lupinus albus TaxID=3870 RepID=A0A6A5NJ38_LUPAL|nr:hypothetical protein Lalb_Chr13g0296721 [Lupinus albus]KAF1887854.1 hypothetical protein Lal_00023862 [Lupinus albus]